MQCMLPIFSYQILWSYILGIMMYYSLIQLNFQTVDRLIYSSMYAFWYIIWAYLVFSLIAIPFCLSTSYAFHQAFQKHKTSLSEVFFYWWKNIFPSFNIYWHQFKYIYLLPSLLLITSLICIIAGAYHQVFLVVWVIWLLWCIITIPYIVYKSIRASLSIPHAVIKNSYDKKSFQESIQNTAWKFWIIFLLLLITSMIIGLTSQVSQQISNFTQILYPWNLEQDITILLDNLSLAEWENLYEKLMDFFASLLCNPIYYFISALSSLAIAIWSIAHHCFLTYIALLFDANNSNNLIKKEEL